MHIKAINDLAQLADPEFFLEIETGAELCVLNARQIYSDSLALDELKRDTGRDILRLAAEEEAAKVLILLDAVRCPRTARKDEFSRQLRYFNDHLAKGIYARCTWRRPHFFEQVREWASRERKEYYLDGPTGVDWIFYNEILRERDEALYVDYVKRDSAHVWHNPSSTDRPGLSLPTDTSPAMRLVSALFDCGILKADALRVVAEVWRTQAVQDDMTVHEIFDLNCRTLERMNATDVLLTSDSEVIDEIANRWTFPLYPLELRRERVRKNDLRDTQAKQYEDD